MFDENGKIQKLMEIKGNAFDFHMCQDIVQNFSVLTYPSKQRSFLDNYEFTKGNDKYVSFTRKKEHKHLNKSSEILEIVSSGIEKLITCICESNSSNRVGLRNELYSNQITEIISHITRMLEIIQAGETGLGTVFNSLDNAYYVVKFMFKELLINNQKIYVPEIHQSLFILDSENQEVTHIYCS